MSIEVSRNHHLYHCAPISPYIPHSLAQVVTCPSKSLRVSSRYVDRCNQDQPVGESDNCYRYVRGFYPYLLRFYLFIYLQHAPDWPSPFSPRRGHHLGPLVVTHRRR